MNTLRLRSDMEAAQRRFDYVEGHTDLLGNLYVKAALQTAQRVYVVSIKCSGYPNSAPLVFVDRPALGSSPHRWAEGQICYMHPSRWNPGRHDIEFVVARTAKWLHKHEVYCATGRWPGAGLAH